jgi:hypothetical protein
MIMNKSIIFNLKLNDNEIDKAGEKSSNFLKSHGIPNETVQAQIMILRELINNGKKFEKPTTLETEITVFLLVEEKTITVEVRQAVEESFQHQLDQLDKTIQWIRAYGDPFEPYMKKLREKYENPKDREANGIGLARIAYEAGAILDFFVSEDNILNLSAVRSLNSGCRIKLFKRGNHTG